MISLPRFCRHKQSELKQSEGNCQVAVDINNIMDCTKFGSTEHPRLFVLAVGIVRLNLVPIFPFSDSTLHAGYLVSAVGCWPVFLRMDQTVIVAIDHSARAEDAVKCTLSPLLDYRC